LKAAIDAGDSSRIAQVFAEAAVAMVPNQDAVQGRVAIGGFYKGLFDAYSTKIEIISLESEVFGDRAFDRGTYRLELTPKLRGSPVVDQGEYIYLLRRQSDGSWKVNHDMSNSSLPVLPRGPGAVVRDLALNRR
jgi:ketosteroid isomerase-like protein